MNIEKGTVIKNLDADEVFENAIIFLTEINAAGAVGFVVNKPFPRKLNELEEFKYAPSLPLFDGGPVDSEHLFIIHCQPALIPGGTEISNGIFIGGDIKDAIQHLQNGRISTNELKVFIGYCGWNENELQTEISSGGWQIVESSPNIFNL